MHRETGLISSDQDSNEGLPPLWEAVKRVVLPDIDGSTYEPVKDGERLGRLLDAVRAVLSDGEWHTLPGLARICGGSETGVSARLRDLRKARFGGLTIESRRRKGGTWEYRHVRA